MIFSKMSKNSAADFPRLYVRSSQQLREFKVSNELLTHRVVITLSLSRYGVILSINSFDCHNNKVFVCCERHYYLPWAKLYKRIAHGKKPCAVDVTFCFLFVCILWTNYTPPGSISLHLIVASDRAMR